MGKQKIHKFFIFPFFAIQLDGVFRRFVPQKARLFALLFSPAPPRAAEQRKLQEKHRGNAVAKVPVPRFVVKNAHPRERAGAAAERCHEQQRLFGYSARAGAFRAALIVAVGEERHDVDEREIDEQRSGAADKGEGRRGRCLGQE